ncbi:MAG: 6-phosphofructokinase [Dethiobacter sp.]|jgi:6-phosphofructokinase 1|nr:6-phosphofructokinase [Dethiobacter sp.]
MKKIAVMTSGGDAPGMNAAIRTVVRKGIYEKLEVIGIQRGFQGLVASDFIPMELGSVADIIHRGGTILRTARAPEFLQKEYQLRAVYNLHQQHIDAVIVIGGGGSFQGAHVLLQHGIKVIGLPGTIDNDITGTDSCIGFDTAVNNVIEAVNKVRDTAMSHERIYVIEVMGRTSGHIALAAGLAGGAESILVPEIPYNLGDICTRIRRGIDRGKLHSIIIVAEGAASALEVGKALEEQLQMDIRVTVLGHIQRGGTPTAFDRIFASQIASTAVDLLLAGTFDVMVGLKNNHISITPLVDVLSQKKPLAIDLYRLAEVLSI